MPTARRTALRSLCAALAAGDLVIDPGADPDRVRAALVALPGIGRWTADYVVMRALGDPDVLLETDLGVRHGAAALGLDATPRALVARAEHWRPWRTYGVHHLWATLEGSPR